MRRIGVATLIASALPATLAAQAVLIAPQAVVVDRGQRAGTFTVVNIGEDRVEVDLSTLYGVPVTDSAGNLLLDTKTPITDSTPSAADWIEMFPRRFALEPGARRTVRLLVRPPDGVPEREYWARLVVASRATPRVAPVAAVEAVNVAITLEVRSVFPFLFRKGTVATALELESPQRSAGPTRSRCVCRSPVEATLPGSGPCGPRLKIEAVVSSVRQNCLWECTTRSIRVSCCQPPICLIRTT